MSEEWRAIPGWEGIYEASNLGRIRSLDRRVWSARGHWARRRGKVLNPSPINSGHLHLYLRRDGRRVSCLVHRAVLEAFVGPCPVGMEACHADGVPTNNALVNLRWDSRAANQQDAVRHKTHVNTKKTHCPRGHAYTPENTRISRRKRYCKECDRTAHSTVPAGVARAYLGEPA